MSSEVQTMNTSGPGKGLNSLPGPLTKEGTSLTFSAISPPPTTVPPPPTTTEEIITTIVAPTDESTGGVISYVLVPIGAIILVFLIVGLIIFLIRKKRLDKLRHHLMPLYNFDPAEEGEDWESELLEDGMDHRMSAAHMKMRVETPSPNDEPKLTFNRDFIYK